MAPERSARHVLDATGVVLVGLVWAFLNLTYVRSAELAILPSFGPAAFNSADVLATRL